MKIEPFATEHFFAQYEFSAPYQLCNSDCETVTVAELLTLADTTMEQFGRLSLGYTESLGHPALREQIAASYPTINTDHVIMLGTPIEGIYLAARAALDPGDEVIVMAPAYDALNNMFAHVVGAENVRTWPIEPTDRGWHLDMDRLRALITPKTKMVVVNFPHNPTGYLPTQDQLAEIIRIVEEKDLLLFCDEMYFGLVLGDTPAITSAADLSKRTIVLSGLSKTYGLPGLRSGWLVVQDEALRQNIINWKFYTSICAPAPSEFLALAAWRAPSTAGQKHRPNRTESAGGRSVLSEMARPVFLAQTPGRIRGPGRHERALGDGVRHQAGGGGRCAAAARRHPGRDRWPDAHGLWPGCLPPSA